MGISPGLLCALLACFSLKGGYILKAYSQSIFSMHILNAYSQCIFFRHILMHILNAYSNAFRIVKRRPLKNNSKKFKKSIDSVKQTIFYLSYQRRTCLRYKPKNKTKQRKKHERRINSSI